MKIGHGAIPTNLASCMLAASFLIFLLGASFLVYIFVYQPKDPKILVNSVSFPAFSLTNNTINFTFLQNVSVKNPNRGSFIHYDSSLEIICSGSQLGFMFIPAGKISGGQTQHMVARFSIHPFQLEKVKMIHGITADLTERFGRTRVEPSMEMESRLKMAGKVRMLKLFMHRVESKARCSVILQIKDGAVLGFYC